MRPPDAGAGASFPVIFLWFSDGFPMVFLHFQLWPGGCSSFASGRRQRVPSSSFPMVLLWFSYIFSSGPVAGDAPPVAAVGGC